MAFEPVAIGTIVVLAAFIAVPLFFFLWIAWRLCFDKQLRSLLDQESQDDKDSQVSIADPPKVLLSFRFVRYSVPVSGDDEKQILKGISGYFKPGTVTAIMGPSGCGKSTLLDILADQKDFGTISGDIRVNGAARNRLFRRATAYVLQFDVLYPQLTPRETLFFVTELRLGASVKTREKALRVRRTLEDLDLSHVADTRIGSGESSGGLSGGQKRRLTVAIELVTGPGLILLDEPTSGLDSYGSLKLVSVLRKLADNGRTIACTIHQPRADIFSLFDNLLLLKFGVTMYFGPVKQIFPYFESLGLAVDYSVNPADFIVDLTQDKSVEEKQEEEDLVRRLDETRQMREEQEKASREEENEELGLSDNEDGDSKEPVPLAAIDENPIGVEGSQSPSADVASLKIHAVQGEASDIPEPAISKSPTGASHIDLDMLCESYGKSEIRRQHHHFLFKITKNSLEDMPPPLEAAFKTDVNDSKVSTLKYASSFLKQSFTLGRRAIVNDMRNSAYVVGNWVIGPIMMLFYGALYSNVASPSPVNPEFSTFLNDQQACQLNDTFLGLYSPSESVQGLTDCGESLNFNSQLSFVRASLIYQFMAAAYFSEGPFVAQVFLDKRMFYREYSAKSYSVAAYHFAYYIRMFFSAFVKGMLFPIFGYFAAQLKLSAEAYFLFSIFFGGMSACGASMALLCSSFFPSLEIAQSVFVLINIIAQNLSGYWIVSEYIGWWFRWMYYINLFRYAFEGAVFAQSLPESSKDYPTNSNLNTREMTWLFALVVLIFAVGLQFFAFCATFIMHMKPKTDNAQMNVGFEEEENEESFIADRESQQQRRTSSGFGQFDDQGKLRGFTRQGFIDRYRNLHMTSIRNIDTGPQLGQVNTTLANNGGIVYTNTTT